MFGTEKSPRQRGSIDSRYRRAAKKKSWQPYEHETTDDGRHAAYLPSKRFTMPPKSGLGRPFEVIYFDTPEAAQEAAETAQEQARINQEFSSLQQTSSHFWGIDQSTDGRYVVRVPGLVDKKRGWIAGSTDKYFETWDEAKNAYFEALEKDETLANRPIVELQLDQAGNRIAFSHFDDFRPSVVPDTETYALPKVIEDYLDEQEEKVMENPNAMTYQKTVAEKRWQGNLFNFVEEYINSDEGKKIARQLDIKNLNALTPRQAIMLANQVVIDLTKYNRREARQGKAGETKSDQSTALEILQDGLAHQGEEDWEGNGICRNFTCCVKAIFDALKQYQTTYSRLTNSYCVYHSDMESFQPEHKERFSRTHSMEPEIGARIGHAWNTFITATREGANATISDATWAKRDLETGKLADIDQTLLRMEPFVHEMTLGLTEDAPEQERQIREALNYYGMQMDRPSVNYKEGKMRERRFFAARALDIIHQHKIHDDLPVGLVHHLAREVLVLAQEDILDTRDFHTTLEVAASHPSNISISSLLTKVLAKKRCADGMDAGFFISPNNEIQRQIYDLIKTRKDYQAILTRNPKFRTRMREAVPEIFKEFDPENNEGDYKEYIDYINNSQYLSRTGGMNKAYGYKSGGITQAIERARRKLETINPTHYQQDVAELEDWQMLRDFDKLHRMMKEK